MTYKIEVTTTFEREVRKLLRNHTVLVADLLALRKQIISDPTQGIAVGKEYYKIRIAASSADKGKWGEKYLVACVKVVQEIVYLLAIYDGTERGTQSSDELDSMLEQAGLA